MEDLASLGAGRGGHTCHTAYALSRLPADQRALIETAMDGLYSSADLARLLNKHAGSRLTGTQVARHRRRGEPNGCKCPRNSEGPA